jgi:hypothetical protein
VDHPRSNRCSRSSTTATTRCCAASVTRTGHGYEKGASQGALYRSAMPGRFTFRRHPDLSSL